MLYPSMLPLLAVLFLSSLKGVNSFLSVQTGCRFSVPGQTSEQNLWRIKKLYEQSADNAEYETVSERIQRLIDDKPLVLFMKSSKISPQCGFSSTAVQILDTYGIDFSTVGVLADESIRQVSLFFLLSFYTQV